MKIKNVIGREILDSRGNPTVEASVVLENGITGTASVPSGASTGQYEALELRDQDQSRYLGRGVQNAVQNINEEIRGLLTGGSASFYEVDARLLAADGTEDKSHLGANAMLAVSLASARAAANCLHLPLYRYLGGMQGVRLPVPMMNILNGGAHASNNLDIQEFMIVPLGFSSFAEALRAGTEIYHTLGKLLKSRGKSTTVGDEGGFAPDLEDEREALNCIVEAITAAGYDTDRVKLALDAASSEWLDKDSYLLPKQKRSLNAEKLIGMWDDLSTAYPLISLEDGVGETDMHAWQMITETLGDRMMLVGDDFFVTNPARLEEGIRRSAANAILVKPNQVGTLTETLHVIRRAQEAGYQPIISHRSGETGDTTIADIAVATNAGFIKTGAPCRYERTAKYNRLLRIESELGSHAVYGHGR